MKARVAGMGMAWLLAAVLLSACGNEQQVEFDVLHSAEERAAPSAEGAGLADLVNGNNAFTFDLYRRLREEEGNQFFSPHSISIALAMTYAGAGGETERQMAEALRFALSQDDLHPAFNTLDLKLASRGEGAQGKDDEGFRLNIVNAVWGQAGCTFDQDFLDVLARNYGVGVGTLDFLNLTEESRTTINEWVSKETEERIRDLIPPGGLRETTVMALTNAIYFNSAWHHEFDAGDTQSLPFHLLDGSTVDTPMMRQKESFGYSAGAGYQAIELFYDGGELSMVILLPDSGRFSEFEESLDAEVVVDAVRSIVYRDVTLTMPRFEFESAFSLAETLRAMGMSDAFDASSADFSGMGVSGCPIGEGRPFIADVFHKAFVLVDEEGTEAAAASVLLPISSSAPRPPIEFKVDRPFVFLIRDVETGAIIFVGRVMDPST